MSAKKILALAVLAYFEVTLATWPGHCDDILAQQNEILSKALRIVLKTEPPPEEITELASYLRSAKPAQYKSLEALFRNLRKSASRVQSEKDYREASSAAVYVLRELDNIAPQTALELFKSWPAPPGFEQAYSNFKKEFAYAKQLNRVIKDPFDYRSESIPLGNTGAWMNVIWKLEHTDPDEAGKAFQQILNESEHQQGETLSGTAVAVARFLKSDQWDASLFSRYFNLLKRMYSRSLMNFELLCDDKAAKLDYAEFEALQLLLWSNVGAHLELTAKLLQAVPVLNEKVDGIGGLEAVWNRGELRQKISNNISRVIYRGNKELNARLKSLCDSFNQNPEEGRQSLKSLESEKNFEYLSRAASAPCPAVSEMASSIVQEMVLSETDAEKRISMALELLPSDFENKRLDRKWIDFGFEILRRAGTRTESSNRGEFEERLIGQLALVDFQRAMSYADAAKKPMDRLQTYFAMLQTLSRELMRAKQ